MKIVFILMFGGILAGVANFFIKYIEIPLEVKELKRNEEGELIVMLEEKPKLTWVLALVGYVFLGIIGSLLTFLINVWVELKGLVLVNPKIVDKLVILGYGIVFGFFTVRILMKTWTIIFPRKDIVMVVS